MIQRQPALAVAALLAIQALGAQTADPATNAPRAALHVAFAAHATDIAPRLTAVSWLRGEALAAHPSWPAQRNPLAAFSVQLTCGTDGSLAMTVHDAIALSYTLYNRWAFAEARAALRDDLLSGLGR